MNLYDGWPRLNWERESSAPPGVQYHQPDMAGTRQANKDRARRLLAEYRERDSWHIPGFDCRLWADEAAELLELIAGAP